MKFTLEIINQSGRLGQLIQYETGKQFSTPLLLQTTKGGSIPYLSREVFDYVSKETQVLQMTLATMDQMVVSLPLYKDTLASYVGFRNYPTLLTIRDPCETMPHGSNERDIVPLYTRRGKEAITPERYMKIVECFAPDIYQGLSDADTNVDSAKKRLRKSVDRTEKFMDYCYEQQATSKNLAKSTLFAPIVGGYSTFARSESIKHTKSVDHSTYGGYCLEGFHNYGLTATAVNSEHLCSIVTHCIGELEAEKARFMPGAYTPLTVLELIHLGIDIFDSSYAYCATVNFKALTFNFDLNDKEKHSMKEEEEIAFLDITNDSLSEDFTPICKNCKCLACLKHTRAYVHHLYKTKELMGSILLMIHNLHHYMEFFKAIRQHISLDQLTALIDLVKYQNTDKPINYRIMENTKVITKTNVGKDLMSTATKASSI